MNLPILIIISPDEITKMSCVVCFLTFDKTFQLFMTTNNSAITPVHEQISPEQIATLQVIINNDLQDKYATQQK